MQATYRPDIDEVAEWRALARSSLKSCQEDVPMDTQKSQLHRRVASLWNVICLDHALLASIGEGLSKFVILPCQPFGIPQGWTGPEPRPPPISGVASDSCSVMMAWVYYTLYRTRLNFIHFQDPSHSANAVILNSIKRAGLWESVLLSDICPTADEIIR